MDKIKAFIQNFGKKNALILAAILIALLVIFTAFNAYKNFKANQIPDVEITLPAFGLIPDLKLAIDQNKDLKQRVDLLMEYETLALFTNYKEVDALVSEIIFLWAGISLAELKTINKNQAIAYFLRRAYDIPDDRPLRNNPYLGGNPWPDQFIRIKSQLLMLGQGKGVYTGRSYYDSRIARMRVEGNVSKSFINDFKRFLTSLPDATNHRNNFLVFIYETKGRDNLSNEDKELLVRL